MNVKLNQIASFSKGKQINGEELLETGIYDYLNGGINPSGKWNEFNAEGNTIAISEGGNSCGYVNYMDSPFWCGAHCYYLFEIKCDVKYLYYALKSQQDRLMRIRTGACMPNIKKNDLGNFEFRFDDNVTLQKCIVYELDFVESLITARREQLAKLDELVKSRFIELFGDLKANPKGWPIMPFPEFAEIDCNMTTDYEKYADYPHIGIDSIEKGTGELKGYRTVREDGVISGKYIFTPQHIIYSKIRPNLNKVALPDFEGLCSADAYPILPNHENCNRVFLAVAMRSEYYLEYILQFSSRTNLPKVNRKEIAGFRMPLPPLALQEQFAAFVEQTDKSKLAVQNSIAELEELKNALMQKYFG